MSAADLLRQLRELGVRIRLQGGELKVSAPQGVLTGKLREQLKANKDELKELLQIADTVRQATPVVIPHVDRNQTIPLSFAQQRMWFLEEFEGGSSVYNISWAMRLKGELNIEALQSAVDMLVQRHESLRTVFLGTDAEPEQKVLSALQVPVEQVPMLSADATEVQAQLEVWAKESFELHKGPLLRVRLIGLGEGERILMMVMHHIITDAWSLDILQKELFGFYLGECDATASPTELAPLPLHFADYAAWQRDHLTGDELERQVSYWADKLRGVPPLLELPTDYPRPPEQSYRGSRKRRLLSAELRDDLKSFAKSNNATLFMVLLAAFDVLLARYSGQDDIVVGTPIAGRQQTELEGLIGLFLNTLVLRSDLSEDLSFNDLLQQVQATALDAYGHQELPFDKIVEALQPSRDMSYSPVFQVQFMLQNAPASGEPIAGLEIEAVEFDYGTSKFDLTLATGETPDGLMAEIEYCADLFDEITIERMLEHYENLLRGALVDPAAPVRALPLAVEADEQSLRAWNATEVDYPAGETLQSLLEAQVVATPDSPALIFASETLTYGELNARANQLAHWLIEQGVGPESMVGVYMERSTDMVVALLAIIKAGGAYVPFDPEYPQQRIVHMLEDANVGLMLVQSHLESQLPAEGVTLLAVDKAVLSDLPIVNPPLKAGADNLAYVIFTSGSTGRPKGVMNEHHGIVNRLLWMQAEYDLSEHDRVLQKTPYSFDVSVWEFFWPLISGAALVVAKPGGHKDSNYLAELISQNAVTTLHFVPSMLQVFLQDELAPSCTSLKRVICSGEALSHDLQARFFAVFKSAGLHNLYGPTEAAIDVSYWACKRDSDERSVPIGRPVANTQIHVVEPSGARAPIGVAGELWIGGEQVARGYVGRPELTAERFIADPFSAHKGARIYRTGDLVRWRNDGAIEFLGRIDHQVKLRGFRIELGEIEAALDSLTAVEQSLVLLREDTPGNKRLVAYVSGKDGTEPQAPELRESLKQQLPEYMLPAVFVALQSFPLLPNGKVDRQALPEPEGRRDVASEYVPPTTDNEKLLAAIWADLLRVDRVGISDNFFELGGDSILSIQIITRAGQKGLRLLPKQVFQYQTIAELAAAAGSTEEIVADQGEVSGTASLTPVQSWFFAQPEIDTHHFNQSISLRLTESLAPELVNEALQAICKHHDALRLSFRQQGDAWLQDFSLANATDLLRVIDLSSAAEEERAEQQLAAANELQASLRLDVGSMLAAVLFEYGEDVSQELIITVHHLAMDGLSWRILLEDLETICGQLVRGELIDLPLKSSSFLAWSERLNEFAGDQENEALVAEANWWATQDWSATAPSPELADGENTVESARTISVALDAGLTSRLLQHVPKAYRTQINDVLLAALAGAWQRWSGTEQVLVDLEGHGREEKFADLDVSRTVGWFTTIYPVRLEASEAEGSGERLKRTKEQLRALPDRGFGYGLLRYLCPAEQRAAVAQIPEPQLLFNYLGQFDQTFSAAALFELADLPRGYEQSPRRLRSHLIDINSSVLAGQLQVGISYSKNLFTEERIRAFADFYCAELEALIEHCGSGRHLGYTPADFPLAELDQAGVDQLCVDGNVADIYPATAMQQGMLFHSQFAQGAIDQFSQVYVTQVMWELEGSLSVAEFERAWQMVVARHEVMRTSFHQQGTRQPLAVVHKHVDIQLGFSDLTAEPAAEQADKLSAYMAADRAAAFDLTQAPLMRVHLLQFGSESYRFVWNHHHVIMDGWSIPLVLNEVFQIYGSLTTGTVPEPGPAHAYRKYIDWLAQQNRDESAEFWIQTLHGLEEPTLLPAANHAFEEEQGEPTYGRIYTALTPDETDRVRQFARDLRLTPNTLVQGIWALLLCRYTGDYDVLYGATTSGRPAEVEHVEQMVGLFLNTLPIRVSMSPELVLHDWLAALQDEQLQARQHEYASLVDIQGWSEIPRGTPLFHTILVYENYPDVETLWSDKEAVRIKDMQALDWTSFPLTVSVSIGQQFVLSLSYDDSYYDKVVVEEISAQFLRILSAIVADPDQQLGDLPLLADAEEQQLLVDWNDYTVELNPADTMHGLFEHQAAAHPEAPALYAGGVTLSYQELNRRANKLAAELQQAGVGEETLVGVCMSREAEIIISLLAVLKAGGAYVPIDPAYPADRVAFMLEDSEAPVLLSQSTLQDQLPPHQAKVICVDTFDWSVGVAEDQNPSMKVAGANLAYTIYTSGSTGIPKGVEIEHRNSVALIRWAAEVFNAGQLSGVLASTSVCFDLSVFEIFVTLGLGGRVVLVRDALELPELPVDAAVSLVNTVPSAIAELLRMNGVPASVETVNLAGEPLQTSLVNDIYATGTVQCVNDLYGPSEDTTYSTWTRREANAPATVGRPIANTQVYLLDQYQKPVPVGVIGEMFLGGAGVTRGYRNRPELTAEKYLPDTFRPDEGGRLYRTGDLARYRPDGNIEFLGRADHQVKLRGFRIELGEIEARLQQQDAVKEAVVIVREDTPGDQRLVAYITSATDTAPDEAALRVALQDSLPAYMIPSAFVLLDAIPLTPNGKTDRKALPAPEYASGAGYAEPRDPTETRLCELWSEVLGVEQVGIHDDFFALGGHSLLAMHLVSRIRDEFKVELVLATLFSAGTVAFLAEQLGLSSGVESSVALVMTDHTQPQPMSFAQQRLWFLDVMEPGSIAYNVPWAIRLKGELHHAAFQAAVDNLVERHKSLRTVFADSSNGPVQIIRDEQKIEVEFLEQSEVDEDVLTARVEELNSRPFDLAEGPLLRVSVLSQGENSHVMVICMHHIICDAWSVGIIYRELGEFYAAAVDQQSIVLPINEFTYADYAVWQHEWLQADVLDHQFAYWKEQLVGAPPLLDMPLDKPRPAIEGHVGGSESLRLGSELTDAVTEAAVKAGTTPFVYLLAAANVLLHRYSGQDDIVVGTPVSGRNRSELEGLIGFFLNTLAIRTDLSGEPTFSRLVERVRAKVLQAFEYQDLPFERLVEKLQPERNRSHSPIFQTLFVYNALVQGETGFGDLQASGFDSELSASKVDLQFTLSELDDGVLANIIFNVDLFDAATIKRMLGHFERLLKAIVINPQQAIDRLALLDETEQVQVVQGFNATAAEFPPATLPGLVAAQAEQTPDALALQFGNDSLSYMELNERANRLAHVLLDSGLKAGDLVGVAAHRSLEAPLAMLAVLKIGAAYVPIDPAYPAERVAYMLEDSGLKLLLTQSSVVSELPEHAAAVIELDRFDWSAGNVSAPELQVDDQLPAYVIYTSGSTGKPKGVKLPHTGLVNLLQWQQNQPGLSAPAKTLQFASYSFDVSFQEIFSTWQQGGALCLIEEDMRRDLPALARHIVAQGIERLYLPFAALQPLVECMLHEGLEQGSPVKDVVVAGEQLQITPPLRRFFAATGARLHNHYGPSETHVVTAFTLDADVDGWPALPPIGRPIANTKAYVLDEHCAPLPVGVPGELYIGGMQVGLGYMNRADLNIEKFLPDPFVGTVDARMYRTGDRVRFTADGNLEYLGRTDDQVKLRGFRVEPGEIEALLTTHADVSQAAVVVREDDPGDKRLVAYVVPDGAAEFDESALRAFVKGVLPEYMVPSAFMTLLELPLTPSGKVNRRLLPVPVRVGTNSVSAAPETHDEKMLALIWQGLLKVDAVGLDDDFFDLGGHSLMTIQLTQQIEKATGRCLTIADIFENPTIREQSPLVDGVSWKMEGLEEPGSNPLSALFGFFKRLFLGRN